VVVMTQAVELYLDSVHYYFNSSVWKSENNDLLYVYDFAFFWTIGRVIVLFSYHLNL